MFFQKVSGKWTNRMRGKASASERTRQTGTSRGPSAHASPSSHSSARQRLVLKVKLINFDIFLRAFLLIKFKKQNRHFPLLQWQVHQWRPAMRHARRLQRRIGRERLSGRVPLPHGVERQFLRESKLSGKYRPRRQPQGKELTLPGYPAAYPGGMECLYIIRRRWAKW